MRTHTQIIKDAIAHFDGVTAFRAALAGIGIRVEDPTVRSWMRRPDDSGSVPPEYWAALSDLGLSSLAELAASAEARRFPDAAAARPERAA